MASELACETGLHRCPDRYKNMFTSVSDRSLRKRVFYSLYTLDRILSAEFGIPIMLSDTDIDTCLPGDIEKHDEGESDAVHPARTPVDQTAPPISVTSTGSHKRKRQDVDDGVSRQDMTPSNSESGQTDHVPPESIRQAPREDDEPARKRLLASNSLIQMAMMIGRAMELFNKSLRFRSLECKWSTLAPELTD